MNGTFVFVHFNNAKHVDNIKVGTPIWSKDDNFIGLCCSANAHGATVLVEGTVNVIDIQHEGLKEVASDPQNAGKIICVEKTKFVVTRSSVHDRTPLESYTPLGYTFATTLYVKYPTLKDTLEFATTAVLHYVNTTDITDPEKWTPAKFETLLGVAPLADMKASLLKHPVPMRLSAKESISNAIDACSRIIESSTAITPDAMDHVANLGKKVRVEPTDFELLGEFQSKIKYAALQELFCETQRIAWFQHLIVQHVVRYAVNPPPSSTKKLESYFGASLTATADAWLKLLSTAGANVVNLVCKRELATSVDKKLAQIKAAARAQETKALETVKKLAHKRRTAREERAWAKSNYYSKISYQVVVATIGWVRHMRDRPTTAGGFASLATVIKPPPGQTAGGLASSATIIKPPPGQTAGRLASSVTIIKPPPGQTAGKKTKTKSKSKSKSKSNSLPEQTYATFLQKRQNQKEPKEPTKSTAPLERSSRTTLGAAGKKQPPKKRDQKSTPNDES